MGVVDTINSSEIKGLSTSACKKKGRPSTSDDLRCYVDSMGQRSVVSN